MVTGDMDSLPKEVLNHFKEINNDLKICYTPDQDETDFSKAVKELSKFCLEESIQVCVKLTSTIFFNVLKIFR